MDPKIETRKDLYEDGALEAERIVRIEADGSEVNHGAYVRWHRNGLKAEEGQFEDGKPVGRWRRWLESGQNFFDGDYLEEEPAAEPLPDSGPIAPETELIAPSAIEAFTGPPLAPERRRQLSIEFFVALAVCWLPHFVNSILMFDTPDFGEASLVSTHAGIASMSITTITVLLYLVWKSGEGAAAFGLTYKWFVVDIALGFVLFLVLFEAGVRAAEYIRPSETDAASVAQPLPGMGEILLIAVALLLNSVAEELAMRAYMIRRVAQVTRSWFLAMVIPSALFGSYHLYQGFEFAALITLGGLLVSVIYWWLRRIWPLVVAHTLYNYCVYAVYYGLLDWYR